jgi:hypothetical protein
LSWSNPGNRNVAGETLLVTLMPLHPETTSNKADAQAADRKFFQFNLTKSYYSVTFKLGNTYLLGSKSG